MRIIRSEAATVAKLAATARAPKLAQVDPATIASARHLETDMHAETLNTLSNNAAMCPGTIEAAEINAMIARNHPLLAMIDGLLRMAAWHAERFDGSPIADDGFTGPYWIDAAKNVRNMYSSASPAGFSAGACEAVFWRAMEIAGFSEGDL